MHLLIIGGSGFLGGTLVRAALAANHSIDIVTRGQKSIPGGVTAFLADRKDANAFSTALADGGPWDLVVDCAAFDSDDARQDVEVFAARCRRFVFISTDFVYHPGHRLIPQPEDPATYTDQGYGKKKREAELVFLGTGSAHLPWTILRPSHIYGPGSQLGCLPLHSRDPALLKRLKNGDTLTLVGGGHFRQHPVFAPDLAETILSVATSEQTVGRIYNVANPDVITSASYYTEIANLLGVEAVFEEANTAAFLSDNPDKAPFCCDRVYDLSALKASDLRIPTTTLRDGLLQQIRSLS